MPQTDSTNTFDDILASAEGGELDAACEIAHRYRLGMGVHQSWPDAINWYTAAHETGALVGTVWLGRIYGGRDGAEPDPEKAMIWLNRAVEAGDTGSMCDLGLHFFNGWGVKTNRKHAAELYRDAAKLGDLWGAYLLGLCYREGAGVKKNRHWALHWLDKAADEHPEARDMAYLIRYGDES